MQVIGKIDRNQYRGISPRIRRDIVVLTEKQRQHIIARRGEEFFNQYSPYFKEIFENPDFIFEDRSHARTAIASKTLLIGGTHINLVIRLALQDDEEQLENSIITAIIENDKRYRQRIRNNLAIYKRE